MDKFEKEEEKEEFVTQRRRKNFSFSFDRNDQIVGELFYHNYWTVGKALINAYEQRRLNSFSHFDANE